jgi:hypothetical protein
MTDLEAVLQAIRDSAAKLRATVQKMMREREKSKSASRHLVSTQNCSRKNILFQAFNE